MSGLYLALQLHLDVRQMQGRSQGGTIFSGGRLLYIPAFIRVTHWERGEERINFRISHIALLCLFVRRACI
jgi:hypothetical protein